MGTSIGEMLAGLNESDEAQDEATPDDLNAAQDNELVSLVKQDHRRRPTIWAPLISISNPILGKHKP